ncbi:MAG: hypothetical protein ACHQ4J_06040 [Candidatus Binatia bacterium]
MSRVPRFLLLATLAWTVLTLPGLVAPPALAMVVMQRDFPELVARAEQVVVGTVTAITQGQDESGAPSTFVTFSDLTVLKGDAGATLTLKFYGGVAGNVAVMIPDMPTFTLGERDVVFVAGNGPTVCPLVGVWQGRFHVRHDETRNTDVIEDSDHTPVTGLVGRKLQRAPLRAAAITLDVFRQMIADELAQPSGPLMPGR